MYELAKKPCGMSDRGLYWIDFALEVLSNIGPDPGKREQRERESKVCVH